MEVNAKPETWKTLLAFAIIYFVWGSRFRYPRRRARSSAVPAGRHAIPGRGLGSLRLDAARGERSPSSREWRSAFIIAILIFVIDYGLLFWAEQRVPSGMAAVMMATIPVFMSLSEIVFLRTQRLTLRLAFALVIGIAAWPCW